MKEIIIFKIDAEHFNMGSCGECIHKDVCKYRKELRVAFRKLNDLCGIDVSSTSNSTPFVMSLHCIYNKPVGEENDG